MKVANNTLGNKGSKIENVKKLQGTNGEDKS